MTCSRPQRNVHRQEIEPGTPWSEIRRPIHCATPPLGDIIGALFLDFRKAFDLVDHTILLNKLSLYNFSNSSLKRFESYLDSRLQAMQSENGLTEFSKISSGVPLGSILGSTLFLLFINDLPLVF